MNADSASGFPRTLLDALERMPNRTAFEHGSRRVSYAEVHAMIRRRAAGMRRAGLGPGRTVAMLVSLTPEGFAAHIAAYVRGCTVVGIRPGWTRKQLAAVLAEPIDAVVSDDDSEQNNDAPPVTVRSRPDDIARVNFTSGSGGQPKGCAWTYRALDLAFDPAHWAPELAKLIDCFQRCLVFGSWSMPIMLTFAGRSLLIGGTVVIATTDDQPVLPYAVERHGITGSLTPVPALHRMLAELREHAVDTSSLRALVVTGSPLSPQRLVEASRWLGPVIWQGYGQAESGMISLLDPDDLVRYPATAVTSVGRVLPRVEVGVRDPDGQPLPVGGTGRIFVRSPQLMSGYWGTDAPRTSDVLENGWLDTRDVGRLDDAGFLYLTGRDRDVIMVNAHVCYASAVERVLTEHPDVNEAYVIGTPDDRTGEAIHAFVVLASGRLPELATLSTRVRDELGDNHVPASITVIPEVPVGAGGKPDKLALRASLSSR